MFQCEFCSKELSTKNNLKIHQAKAKYCLEKQNKKVTPEFSCKYCSKEFNHCHRKDEHENICVVKPFSIDFEQRLKKLSDENTLLKMELDKMKDRANIEKEKTDIYEKLFNKDQEFILSQSAKLIDKSGNNITNIKSKYVTMNALNLSQERLHSIKDTYTINHYERGGIGQADWVIENVLKDESGNIIYKCTDKNRRNFIYQDDKGNTVTDIHAKRLKEAILPVIETKLKEYKKVKYSELADVSDDESELLEKCNELYKENKELGNDFDKRLVEKTYI